MSRNSKGRRNGKLNLDRPIAIGESSGWWFPWQVEPWKLRMVNGQFKPMYRKTVYARPVGKKRRARLLVDQHVATHGQWCPGLPELLHRPHFLTPAAFLTIDHIVPLHRGGTWAKSNLRIICDKANMRLNAIMVNGKRKPDHWW